jgi:hypothetical protein
MPQNNMPRYNPTVLHFSLLIASEKAYMDKIENSITKGWYWTILFNPTNNPFTVRNMDA